MEEEMMLLGRLVGSQPHASNARRDLELILLGAALGKGNRKEILEALPKGGMIDEFCPLLEAIRDGKPEALRKWLLARGVTPSGNLLKAILGRVVEWNERIRLVALCEELGHAAKVFDAAGLREKMLEMLRKVEEDGLRTLGHERDAVSNKGKEEREES